MDDLKKKILLVDDDNLQRELFSRLLEENGYEVLTAPGGEEALSMLEDLVPDLILLDIMMPRVGGIDACKVMRSSRKLSMVPIVMLTAVDTDDYIVEALDAGADDYILKNANHKVVCARVRAHLRSKTLYDEVERLRKDQSIITDTVIEMNSNKNLQESLQGITQKISSQIGGRVSVVIVKKDSDTGKVIASSDMSGGGEININLSKYPELIHALNSNRPLLISDVRRDSIMENVADKLREIDVSSLMVIPLLNSENAVDLMLLRARGDGRVYDMEDERLCRTIAGAMATALRSHKVEH